MDWYLFIPVITFLIGLIIGTIRKQNRHIKFLEDALVNIISQLRSMGYDINWEKLKIVNKEAK